MLRVLHVLGTLDMGGIENFLMNIYRNIDRNKIQFDFVINDREKEDIFEKEVRSLGGKIYKIPPIVKVGHFKYFKSLREILQKNNYNIIHSHYNAISGFILHEAKKVGIKNRIAHSHIAYPKYSFLSKIYKEYSKFILKKNVTVRFACSEKAGQWLYGKKESFTVIKNGINVSKFSYNTQIREEKRKELNINSDEIVLGHIGRFTKQKNHEYLIEIFRKLHMKNEKYRLILVGTGELEINILEKIKKALSQQMVDF